MFETISDWFTGRRQNAPGIFKLFSFLLFLSLCITTASLVSGPYRWLFGVLVAVDGLASLIQLNSIVESDRSIFLLISTILAMTMSHFDIFFTSIVALSLFAVLDFSLLLRKVDGTIVDFRVLAKRAKSYTFTVLPAFLLTYLFLVLYSNGFQFNLFRAIIVLGFTSVGAIVIVYFVIRYMFSLKILFPDSS